MVVPRTGRESLVAIGDKSTVPPGASGFCECENGRRADFPHVTTKVLNVTTYAFMANGLSGRKYLVWNDWRDVEFREDHTFYAPDGNCDNEECTWRTDGGNYHRLGPCWRSQGEAKQR